MSEIINPKDIKLFEGRWTGVDHLTRMKAPMLSLVFALEIKEAQELIVTAIKQVLGGSGQGGGYFKDLTVKQGEGTYKEKEVRVDDVRTGSLNNREYLLNLLMIK